jgi:hypothetical protein
VDDFAAATGAPDPFVRNLAFIGMGLALDALGRTSAAINAYESAVDAMPRARASAVQLAAHLYLQGDRQRASALLDGAFGPDALDLEPWRHILAWDRWVSAEVAWLRADAGVAAAASTPRAATTDPRPTNVYVPEPTLSAARPDSPVPNRAQAFRSRTNAVSLDVLVELARQPVAGLTAADFELRDLGQVQSVNVSEVSRVPLDVSLVVDLLNEIVVGKGKSVAVFNRTRQDLLEVARLLGPGDRLRLLQVDGQVAGEVWGLQAPPFPVDRIASIPEGSAGRETALPKSTYGRMQALFDVVTAALLRETSPDRRHLVIVFTDGIDGASIISPELFLAVARESQAVMYLARRDTQAEIAEKQRIPRAIPYAQLLWPPDHRIIEKAASITGGSAYYHPAGTLLPDFTNIFDRFRRSYTVSYQPSTEIAGWHDISIRIKRSGDYHVVSRKGYTVR